MDLGIIGGQDGPAAVLVSGGFGLFLVPLLLAVLIAGAVWLFWHKRKK